MPGEDLARSGDVHPPSHLPSCGDSCSALGTIPIGVRPRVSLWEFPSHLLSAGSSADVSAPEHQAEVLETGRRIRGKCRDVVHQGSLLGYHSYEK